MIEASNSRTAFTGRAWLLIAVFLFVESLVFGLYALAGRTPPTAFQLLAWLGSGLLFAYLVRRDRMYFSTRASLPDLGFLVLVAWPVVVPYHFFAMRGRRGWRPFLLFAAIVIAAYAIQFGFYASYLRRAYPFLIHSSEVRPNSALQRTRYARR